MVRSKTRWILAMGIAGATSACILAVPTDGLSGGAADASLQQEAADAPVRDAGTDTTEASSPDARDGRAVLPDATTWSGNGHAYAVYVVPDGLTWEEARVLAEQAGGHLATISSADENDFVINLAKTKPGAFNAIQIGPWLGGHQPNPVAADEPARGWQWVDGTPWAFKGWRVGQPDNTDNIENFLDLYGPSGDVAWNDDPLDGSSEPAISYVVEVD